MDNELSVLSLNCWGLHVVSKRRQHRLEAIANVISTANYDIVTLQELWVAQDLEYLKQKTQDTLPYVKYFYSGALGSGLAILSRFPIVGSSYFRYTLAGRPLKVFHGDFYVGKGCASACIEHPVIGILEVFTTHLHAGYGTVDEYEGHRVSESWELANRVRSAAAQGRQVIVTGDFNSIPTTYNYQLLKSHAFLCDAWLQVNQDRLPSSQDALGDLDETEVIQRFGVTCNSPVNTWCSAHHKNKQPRSVGDRLDYIFYRRTPQLTCKRACVDFVQRIPSSGLSYSDHFGVHATFGLSSQQDAPAHALRDMSPTQAQLMHPGFSHLPVSVASEILTLLRRDHAATRKTANLLLTLFLASVMSILAVYGTAVSLPFYYDPHKNRSWPMMVATLLSGLLLITFAVTGTICLIVGFVFGRTEQRALLQFIKDVETLVEQLKHAPTPSQHPNLVQLDHADPPTADLL